MLSFSRSHDIMGENLRHDHVVTINILLYKKKNNNRGPGFDQILFTVVSMYL